MTEDRALVGIRISAPATVSYDFTRTQMQTIEQLVAPYRESGEVESIYSVSGFGSAGRSTTDGTASACGWVGGTWSTATSSSTLMFTSWASAWTFMRPTSVSSDDDSDIPRAPA